MASRRWCLCVPPVVLALFDYVVTMCGQPAHYWAGDYRAADEENPLVYWAMAQHPIALHGLTLVWIVTIIFVVCKLPRFLARAASLSITVCHTFCAGTWLYPVANGFYISLAICIGSALTFVIAIELSREDVQ